jgi:hypothetical protein
VIGPPLWRYVSPDEDSARWCDFPFRPGDIVISTRSKSGTTWVQMICALLVFQSPELPDSLGRLSPWLDWLVQSRQEVVESLEAQEHRRFIKTHTPLDGVPWDHRVTYIMVARHPLDMAVSLYHHGDNLDRERIRQLTGQPAPALPPPARPPLREWLMSWVEEQVDPKSELDSLPGVMWHLTDVWARRNDPNVILLHYDDLSHDLDGAMRQLAHRLGIAIDASTWPDLVRAATFSEMRRHAVTTAPDNLGVLKDQTKFFRHGRSGEGTATLTGEELARYHQRVAALAPADMVQWLHSHDSS